MMDREGIKSKRDDNRHETILELTSTGNSSEILPCSGNEVGEGSRKIKSASSKDAQVQSLPTPGEQRSDEPEGGQRKSRSFWLFGRRNSKSKKVKRVSGAGKKDAFGEKRGAMMVVSVLIATLTYQAALNPPGGFWQEEPDRSADTQPPANLRFQDESPPPAISKLDGIPPPPPPAVQKAGTAINREYYGFQYFLIANTVGLFASLVIILLLTSAITIKRQIMMWVLMFIMWISVFSVACSFWMGAVIILRDTTYLAINYLNTFVLCCFLLFALLVILHIVVGLKKICRWATKKPSDGEEV